MKKISTTEAPRFNLPEKRRRCLRSFRDISKSRSLTALELRGANLYPFVFLPYGLRSTKASSNCFPVSYGIACSAFIIQQVERGNHCNATTFASNDRLGSGTFAEHNWSRRIESASAKA